MGYRLPLLTIWIAIALGAGCGGARSAVPSSRLSGAPSPCAEGQACIPRTPLVELDGRTTDLPSVIQGRAAIVSFWATWCDACSREIPVLERLHSLASARDDGLVVGVAVGEPRAAVAAFIRDRGVRTPQLVDETYQLADALGERRVPSTLVIDRAGRVVFREGALDAAGLAVFRQVIGRLE
jgi:cytochrome c biogenesis protein CcmG, thiol:disulfide interchange protein DsbE